MLLCGIGVGMAIALIAETSASMVEHVVCSYDKPDITRRYIVGIISSIGKQESNECQ